MTSQPSNAFQTLMSVHRNMRLNIEAEEARVLRAWPGKKGEIHVEFSDPQRRVRAMKINASGQSEVTPYARDRRLPLLSPPTQGRVVVHRFAKRAVILTESHVHKYVRPEKGGGIIQTWKHMSILCARAAIHTPRIESAQDGKLTFSKVPGRTLNDLGNDGIDGWRVFAQRWPALAQQSSTLATFSPEDEARTLNVWFTQARTHGSLDVGAHMSAAVQRVCAELADHSAAIPQDQWVTTHRDLHDKQILWDGERLTVLDADTAVRAEAALDIANLQAHIDLRHVQGKIDAPMHAQLTNITGELAQTLRVPHKRFNTYLQSSKMRLACVYSFLPSARVWLDEWIDKTLSGQ